VNRRAASARDAERSPLPHGSGRERSTLRTLPVYISPLTEAVVKVAGRALDIVAVGLGQAGGNLAAEFAHRGHRALAFNTAVSDLSTLSSRAHALPEDQRVYIGIDGHDGAGSDASYGRECVSAHAQLIRERVAALAIDADIVLVTAGLGGGTGSAVAELVTVLDELNLPLMVLATLPASHESGVAKVNAVRAVNELIGESLLGWIFIDNARLAESHGNISLDRYYPEINKVIVEQLDALNRLNERDGVRPIRPIDGEDLRTLLLSGGLLNFGAKQLATLDSKSVIEAVRECLQFSSVMPQGYSLESVSYLGLALDAPESVLSSTPFSLFEQIAEQLKDETGGAAVYLGIYREERGDRATLRVVASSQALPEGMREMVGVAKREGAQLRSKLDKTVGRLDLAEIDQIQLFRSGASASRRPRSVAPAAMPSVLPPGRPSEAPALANERMSVGSAERKAYEQLVRDYRAGADDAKKRIAQRLEADVRSTNLITRFYAVRAITKIDPALFADALRAAAKDEDSTVRSMASKALSQLEAQEA
jgi:cell division GTPase FtsZ